MSLGEAISHYPSGLITILTALAFLWLALYVYRVNPEDPASRLASLAMAVVFLYLLGDFMVRTSPDQTRASLYLRSFWLLPFAPVLWLHLSQKLTRPLEFRGVVRNKLGRFLNLARKPSALGALYGCAAVFAISASVTDSLFSFSRMQTTGFPLLGNAIPTGSVYTLFAIFVFATAGLAWINFLAEWWAQTKSGLEDDVTFIFRGVEELFLSGIPFVKSNHRSRFWWLSLGSILFWVSSAGLFVKSVTGFRLEYPVGDALLGSGMAIVAIAILKHEAFVKKESLERDVVYASIGALGIAGVYALAVIAGQGSVFAVPVATLVIVASLALTTHMLADNLKVWFGETIGKRLGLVVSDEVDKMKELYYEASRLKRVREPAIQIFGDGGETAERLLSLLTPRQQEIIVLRAKGLSDKQIAVALGVKLPTVRKHVEDIKSRIGSRDKADSAIYCIVTGLLGKEDLVDWFDSLNIPNGCD